jgi:hypothetical protein
MELQQNLNLIYDVDAVLHGQGVDASILHARRPRLVKEAEEAIQESISLEIRMKFRKEYNSFK